MSGSRRNFLQYLGAGALGSTAALLPTQAQAFHFGRNRPTCEVEVVPPCGGPAGGSAGLVPKRAMLLGVASISFPQPGGDQANPQIIFGGNAFCAWGYLNNLYSLTQQVPPPPAPGTPPPPPPPPPPLQLFDTNNVVVPATIQMMPAGVIAGLAPCTWAFTIDQVPSGTIFLVQLNYVSNSNPTKVLSLQTAGYFACGGT